MIDVIGIGADGAAGVRPALVERIHDAEFLAGGERHLTYFPEARGQRFVLRDNLTNLIGELSQRWDRQRCVVLASGDPLFYGVGSYLIGILGPDALRIEPAVSSMQLAFARAGLPWHDAALASVHGRDLRRTLIPLLGRGLIGLFTQDGDSPAEVARFFLERGLNGYEAVVAEDLGGQDERVSRVPDLESLSQQRFRPLNYLILVRHPESLADLSVPRRLGMLPGVPDAEFARPEDAAEVMTRQEVRAIVLAKLLTRPYGAAVAWDIGAGLGTVAVEVGVLRPDMEVVAVERDAARAAYLRENRDRFNAFNVRLLQGSAPAVLFGEAERPHVVFIGGSGGNLSPILDLVQRQLVEGGRLVASFVTLEHLSLMIDRLKLWQWPFEVTEVHVSRSDSLAGLTGMKPMRGVFIVSADKPGGAA